MIGRQPTPRPVPAAAEPVEPTLAEQVAKATTSNDHAIVKLRIGRLIAAAETRLAELDRDREQSAIDGTTTQNNRDRWDVGETIASLKKVAATQEKLRDEAETREILATMIAGAEAARAMVPEIMAEWRGLHDDMAALRARMGRIRSKQDDMDGRQAHALRAERKDLITLRATIRGEAAALCPRLLRGAESKGPETELDNIARLGKVVVEELNDMAVHHGDAFRARRTNTLVDIRSRGEGAGQTVEPTSTTGRPQGGFGRGVA